MQERETTSQYLGSESHFASMADDSPWSTVSKQSWLLPVSDLKPIRAITVRPDSCLDSAGL